MLQATLEAVASGFGRTCVGLREASCCTQEKNLWYSGYFQAAITFTTTQCGDKARHTFSLLNGLSILRDVN